MNDESLINNQTEIKPKKGRGGKRPGAGRKVGSTNKITGQDFLTEYLRVHGNSLTEDLVKDMLTARQNNDKEMLFKYQTAFAKYFFADTAEQKMDITSNGQTLTMPTLMFEPEQLTDWQEEQPPTLQ